MEDKYVVSRAIGGVTINGKEFLLHADTDKVVIFKSVEAAHKFMEEQGVSKDEYEVELQELQ